MKRSSLLKKIRKAAKDAGLAYEATELSNHTGIKIGDTHTIVARHTEISDLMAEVICKQLEPALGKGWWRK